MPCPWERSSSSLTHQPGSKSVEHCDSVKDMGSPSQPRFHVLAPNLCFLIYDMGIAGSPLRVGCKVQMRPFKSHGYGQCSVNGGTLWLYQPLGSFHGPLLTIFRTLFALCVAAVSSPAPPPWKVVGIPDPSGPLLAPLEQELAGWGVGRHPLPYASCYLGENSPRIPPTTRADISRQTLEPALWRIGR